LLWMIWVLWVPLMIPTILGFLRQHPTAPQAFASLGGVAIFFAVYLAATLHETLRLVTLKPAALSGSSARSWVPLAVLIVLGIVLAQSDVQVWGQLFIYAAAYAGVRLPTIQGVLGVAVVFVITALGIWRNEPSWGNFFGGAVFVGIVGAVCIIMARSRLTSRDLRAAREEVARLAVAAERLRFARDLHDLLGHSLSLIALKTELARQLVEVNTARAASELDDIERAARESLREVREAVSGYRQATLASELHEAEKMLAAAGITYRRDADDRLLGSLSPTAEAVLSWTVREGVTNVMRHSRARHCHIRVMRAGQDACIEIGDDGGGWMGAVRKPMGISVDDGSNGSEGNGLRGLAERVEALGGRFEAGPGAGGGFRLAVSIPAQHEDGDTKDVASQRASNRRDEKVRAPARGSADAANTGGGSAAIEEARETA
ncbi:MAG TPA: sensor histidine kinase, partial [Ktedonobacterales bacterium]|nr:sensor histidine kinase [Ktedonobacterales bacterium]